MVACRPTMASTPREKIRIATIASIRTTPCCADFRGGGCVHDLPSAQHARVRWTQAGQGGIAHPGTAARADRDAQALVAPRCGQVDLRKGQIRGRSIRRIGGHDLPQLVESDGVVAASGQDGDRGVARSLRCCSSSQAARRDSAWLHNRRTRKCLRRGRTGLWCCAPPLRRAPAAGRSPPIRPRRESPQLRSICLEAGHADGHQDGEDRHARSSARSA